MTGPSCPRRAAQGSAATRAHTYVIFCCRCVKARSHTGVAPGGACRGACLAARHTQAAHTPSDRAHTPMHLKLQCALSTCCACGTIASAEGAYMTCSCAAPCSAPAPAGTPPVAGSSSSTCRNVSCNRARASGTHSARSQRQRFRQAATRPRSCATSRRDRRACIFITTRVRTAAWGRGRKKRRSRVCKRLCWQKGSRAPAARSAVVLAHDQPKFPATSVTVLAVGVVVPEAWRVARERDQPVQEVQSLHRRTGPKHRGTRRYMLANALGGPGASTPPAGQANGGAKGDVSASAPTLRHAR